MFIYDEIINKIEEINSKYTCENLKVDINKSFEENPNQIIFKDDKKFELGSGTLNGINIALLSDNVKFDKNEIVLIGKDLNKIKEDTDYARITIANIDLDKIGKDNTLYQNIRKFDYVKYHFALDGVMVRESTFNQKESIIVSKTALKKNKIDFSILGSYFINQYKKLPFIKNVKIIFVNEKSYDYHLLLELMKKEEKITKALDHLTSKVKMDCHTCSLQVICDEVEKKVKADFK